MNQGMNNPMAGMMQNMVGRAMQNNPVFALMNVMRNGGNPQALLQQMAQKDPRVAQAMKMMQGKNNKELETMVRNMCKERNTTPEEVAQQLGIPFPTNGN